MLGAADSDLLLFTAGRFVRKKGFEYLIDALAELGTRWPGLRLVIGGGGDLDAELHARAAARGVSGRVVFPGVLGHDEVAEYLAAADVAVVPSVRDDAGNVDGLPNVVMEAMASATPLVATTAGGIGAVASDNRTALLVAERDVAGLVTAIDRLLRAPEERIRIGRAARTLVAKEYAWSHVAERFEAAYRRAREPWDVPTTCAASD